MLAVMAGVQWYDSRQPAEEAGQPRAVEQRGSEQQTQPSQAEARQATPPKEPPSQQQAKAEPPSAAEQVRQEVEGRKQTEATQRVAELLARADKQKTVKRLTTPAGDNAVETYRELLRIAPGQQEALAGLQDIKAQYRQLGEAAQQRGEWAEAQGHYEAALEIDPQDKTLTAALQQVTAALQEMKKERKVAPTVVGWYVTTSSTSLLKTPQQGASVIRNLEANKRVYVVGVVGNYFKVESRQGNPPGYISRRDVVFSQGREEVAGQAEMRRREEERQERLRAQEEAKKQAEADRQAEIQRREKEQRQQEEQRLQLQFLDCTARILRGLPCR